MFLDVVRKLTPRAAPRHNQASLFCSRLALMLSALARPLLILNYKSYIMIFFYAKPPSSRRIQTSVAVRRGGRRNAMCRSFLRTENGGNETQVVKDSKSRLPNSLSCLGEAELCFRDSGFHKHKTSALCKESFSCVHLAEVSFE